MIEVQIHLHSARGSERDRKLATVLIVNDGTGDGRRGDYVVTATRDGRRTYQAKVGGFPRGSRSVLELLRRGLNAIAEGEGLP